MMTKQQLEQLYNTVCTSVYQRNLKHALDTLQQLVVRSQSLEYRAAYDQMTETYRYMLQYTIRGYNDPQREQIYDKLRCSIIELADRCRLHHWNADTDFAIYVLEKENRDAINLSADTLMGMLVVQKEAIAPDRIIRLLFNRMWLHQPFSEPDMNLMKRVMKGNELEWYEKSLVVTGLTLSLLRSFDETKLLLLADFYQHRQHQVWQRALVGLVMILYTYNQRVVLYPRIKSRLGLLTEIADVAFEIEMVMIQLIKSRETEKIARQIREEIIPQVSDLTPQLMKEFDLDSMAEDSDSPNPDWQHVFEDKTDLLKKMGEFSMLQIEGSDVFMSAFAQLKHFDFFRDMHNWFAPFSHHNKAAIDALSNEDKIADKQNFLQSLERVPFMCNSDKYSFCLNLPYLSGMQKNMMINIFTADLEAMTEMAQEDELIKKGQSDRYVITQYLQDFYRFYKLHNLRHSFADIFSTNLDVVNTHLFDWLVNDNDILRNIAEMYFGKDYYTDAIAAYSKLVARGINDGELYQKIGYSYQKQQQYAQALDYYLKAELFDVNKKWSLRKIALCYQRTGKLEQAIEYYLEAEKLLPDDQALQISIGVCYMELQQFDKALKYLYRIEYASPDNLKVMRPISWCSFVTGKFDNARRYLERILEKSPNRHDYMNFGHVAWCQGKREEAAQHYSNAIKSVNGKFSEFFSEFNVDTPYLISNGVASDEIPLMLDHLRYENN